MKKTNFSVYEENYNLLPFEPIMIEYRRKFVIECIQKYNHENILEIGCGNDPIFCYFNDYKTMKVIEPGRSFYNNALKRIGFNDKIHIFNDIFENASSQLKGSKFDFIIISCLLHEISDTCDFLVKLHEICSPDTIIHINVPNANSFHRLLAVEAGIIDNIYESSSMNLLMKQEHVFDLTILKELLSSHGFNPINSGSYFVKPFTHSQMSQIIEDQIIDRNVLEGLSGMIKYLPDLGSEIFVNCKI